MNLSLNWHVYELMQLSFDLRWLGAGKGLTLCLDVWFKSPFLSYNSSLLFLIAVFSTTSQQEKLSLSQSRMNSPILGKLLHVDCL